MERAAVDDTATAGGVQGDEQQAGSPLLLAISTLIWSPEHAKPSRLTSPVPLPDPGLPCQRREGGVPLMGGVGEQGKYPDCPTRPG